MKKKVLMAADDDLGGEQMSEDVPGQFSDLYLRAAREPRQSPEKAWTAEMLLSD